MNEAVTDALPQPELPPEHEAVGKHRVREEIGRGGMGRVLRVRDTELKRDVAMKLLRVDKEQGADPERFVAEARLTGRLDHPNVLPVHELGTSPAGEPFFTMKLVEGHQSLRDVIEELEAGDPDAHERFSFEQRVQVIQQVCDALHYAHQRGVIHRDVKPENVVVGSCGEVYLVDWGVAKQGNREQVPVKRPPARLSISAEDFDPRLSESDPHRRVVTQEGELLGTPAYMAPEQLKGDDAPVGPWTDVYGLCATLYEFLSLHHYLDGANTTSYLLFLSAVLLHEPTPAEDHREPVQSRVPRNLSRICQHGLAKEPAERWESVAAMRQALQLWLEGRAPAICPGTTLQRLLSRLSRWIDDRPVLAPTVVLTLGALLLASGGLGVALLLRGALS